MKKHVLTAAAGLAALTSAQTAQAQQACVAPADLSATVVYVMPVAYDAAKSVCAKTLKSDGFMATKGDKFIAPFRAKQSKSWPGTFRLMKTFMEQRPEMAGDQGFDVVGLLSSLPESSVRPFVDGLLGQLIADEIKPSNCTKIERGMELLGPLPTENVAGLAAFAAEMADLKNPSICAPAKK